MFCKKRFSQKFRKVHWKTSAGKHLCHQVPHVPTPLLKKLWHRCFPVNFTKLSRTSFWQNVSGRLLLNFVSLGKPIDSYWFKLSCLSCLVFICVHCCFPKMMKLYKDICSAWIIRTSAEIFFLKDWRQKRLKNTIYLLLFCGEHFHEFSESVVANLRLVGINQINSIDFPPFLWHFAKVY